MRYSLAEIWRAFRGRQEYDYELVGLILCDLRNIHRGPDDEIFTLKNIWKSDDDEDEPDSGPARRPRRGSSECSNAEKATLSTDAFFAIMLGKPVPPGALSG